MKCTDRREIEITRDDLLEFMRQRLKDTDKKLSDSVKFLVSGPDPDGEGGVHVLEVDAAHPLTVSYTEVSEV